MGQYRILYYLANRPLMLRRVYSIAYGAQKPNGGYDIRASTILALDAFSAVQSGMELSAEVWPNSQGYTEHKCYAVELPDWATKYNNL